VLPVGSDKPGDGEQYSPAGCIRNQYAQEQRPKHATQGKWRRCLPVWHHDPRMLLTFALPHKRGFRWHHPRVRVDPDRFGIKVIP
jgi:hypothetical protein